jgi:hypothetical protein
MKRFLLAVVAVVFVGCDSGVTGISTVTGNWSLRTVNGSNLPFTVSGSGANKTEILDDVITLYEGFTFSETIHQRVTTNGQVSAVTSTETGAYSLFGTSVTLAGNTRERRGRIEESTMTLVENGMTSAYRK